MELYILRQKGVASVIKTGKGLGIDCIVPSNKNVLASLAKIVPVLTPPFRHLHRRQHRRAMEFRGHGLPTQHDRCRDLPSVGFRADEGFTIIVQ